MDRAGLLVHAFVTGKNYFLLLRAGVALLPTLVRLTLRIAAARLASGRHILSALGWGVMCWLILWV
jgi:hypothetical protein